jgi:hypothetical protein
MKLGICVAMLVALVGCSTPSPLSEEASENLNRLATGPASAKSDNTEVGTAAAASYLGDVRSDNIRASAQRQVTSTTSGHVQQGFTLGASVEALEAVQSDPLVQSLVAELAALQSAESPDTERIDAVRLRLKNALDEARQAALKMGGDLSSLSHLTVVNVMRQATGAEQPAVTKEDAEAAKQIPETLRAARGGE